MTAEPALVVVVDQPDRRTALIGDLARRFDRDYVVAGITSAEADGAFERYVANGTDIAAVVADAQLPDAETTGVELLSSLRRMHPAARRILLVQRGEWRGHPIQQAMVLGQVDAYLFVPWAPKELWLYQPMTECLADWSRSRPTEIPAFTLVGDPWRARSHQLRDLLSRGAIPFVFHAADSAPGLALLRELGVSDSRLPLVVHFTGKVLENPTNQELADVLGFPAAQGQSYDVVIVGGGPAGLSAAVYASSEGLRTCVVDPSVPGGQAGSSSLIRNYLGFPRGVSGVDLTTRAVEQAWLLGTEFVLAEEVSDLVRTGDGFGLSTVSGNRIAARSVVLACGVQWRRLGVPALEALVGAGVFYGAAGSEAEALTDKVVYVVGGGNSAGQAAIHLARRARRVSLVVRRSDLSETMSDYLVRQLAATGNINVLAESEVVGGSGGPRLERLLIRARLDGQHREMAADGLFVMIGGEPCTRWLGERIATDAGGYLLTGGDVVDAGRWRLSRAPLYGETSEPGVFAVGDVAHGSSKRVAPSVGAGAVAVQMVHRYLSSLEAAGE
jgi:thioredoxin reductase (NADPH)